MRTTTIEERTWWARPGLEVRDGRLTIAGRDAEALAREQGTPLYAYDLVRVEEQARALEDAFAGAGLRGLVRLALKAQREPALLRFLRERVPSVGIDVCSPGEIAWALDHGWAPSEISYTGTNVSDRDLGRILGAGVHLNVDLLSQLDRVGRSAPGSSVGIRVNPRIGASREGGGETLYTGPRPTKFGIFAEQLPDALAIAARHGLTIDTVHFHVGDGYLDEGLPDFEETVRRGGEMVAFLQAEGCPIGEVNTGGGLGVPQRAGDRPLDLIAWADILARHLGAARRRRCHRARRLPREGVRDPPRRGRHGRGARGPHVRRASTPGWNVMCEHFVYGSMLDLVLCRAADADPVREVTVSGHINEGDDLFAVDLPLPEVVEGDILAAIAVGSYNASMTSEHCLREPAGAVCFEERR